LAVHPYDGAQQIRELLNAHGVAGDLCEILAPALPGAEKAAAAGGVQNIQSLRDLRAEGQFKLPFTHEILTSTELYTFYDIGSVWHIDDNARGKRDSAASLGAGVRFALQNRLYGYLEVADPLTASVPTRGDEGNSPRFFFSLTAPL